MRRLSRKNGTSVLDEEVHSVDVIDDIQNDDSARDHHEKSRRLRLEQKKIKNSYLMDYTKKIVIISDGTGKTAKRLMDAVLAQYSQDDVGFTVEHLFQQVRDHRMLDDILTKIDKEYLVIFSIIEEELGSYCHQKLLEKGILHINILEPMLETMSKFLGVHPDYKPGILQIIDDKYYEKIDAIGFAVEHDDGRGHIIEQADIVLLGPSRTCKTPISMYLACNFGIKAANIPVFPDPILAQNILARLSPLSKNAVFGLTMQPDVLLHVRQERSQYLAHHESPDAGLQKYLDLREIRAELKFCRNLLDKGNWQEIDVTRRAIEEISQELLENIGRRP